MSKNTQPPQLPRCPRVQDLLRQFSSGTGPAVSESARYLAVPFYHTRGDGRTVTVAGDGRGFIWALSRVPGFADYQVPPAGFGYFELPRIWGLYRPGSELPAPLPRGAWGSRQADTVFITQSPAVVRRYDLARLQLLDTCTLGPGEAHRDAAGRPCGWKSISFRGTFGSISLQGVVFCDAPPAVRQAAIRANRAKSKLKMASK